MLHEPTERTRAQVEVLSSFGVPQVEIAEYIGIADSTLRKYYGEEMLRGRTERNGEVGEFLFNAASGRALKTKGSGATHADCIRAAMFWAKTRMGFRETNHLDHTSSDGTFRPTGLVDPAAVAELAKKLVE